MRLGLRRLEGLIVLPRLPLRYGIVQSLLCARRAGANTRPSDTTNLPEAEIGVNWTKVSLELHSARSGWRR